MTITPSATDWTNKDIILTVAVEDALSGLKSITGPAGATTDRNTDLSGTSASIPFTVAENGTFSFSATDNSGNIVTESFTVTNIDKEAPQLTVKSSKSKDNKKTVTVKMSDSDSGLRQLRASDGAHTDISLNLSGESSEIPFTVVKNGTYTFDLSDAAGNLKSRDITVTDITGTTPPLSANHDAFGTDGLDTDGENGTFYVDDSENELKSSNPFAGYGVYGDNHNAEYGLHGGNHNTGYGLHGGNQNTGLPNTGGLPVAVFAGLGLLVIALGVFLKIRNSRKKRNQRQNKSYRV
jgi:LPXTG-motif cell wall-anchored protein